MKKLIKFHFEAEIKIINWKENVPAEVKTIKFSIIEEGKSESIMKKRAIAKANESLQILHYGSRPATFIKSELI